MGESSGVGNGRSLEEIVVSAQQAMGVKRFSAIYKDNEVNHSGVASMPKSAVGFTNSRGAPKKRRLESHTTRILTAKPKAAKRASTRTACHFCEKSDGHNITSCKEKVRHGKHLLQGEIQGLLNELDAGHSLDSSQPTNIQLPLKSVPKRTKWLVLHRLCVLKTTELALGASRLPSSNYGIIVTCLGVRGVSLDEKLYTRCLVVWSAVRTWIEKTRNNDDTKSRSLSKVFSAIEKELSATVVLPNTVQL